MRTKILIAAIVFAAVFTLGTGQALAIHRSVVLSRGRTWLYDKVPYSQSKYHLGYRTDCSGFVSMCWQLTEPSGAAESLSTRSLYTVSTKIKTSALAVGDAECFPNHHTFLFVAWTDLAHTAMVTLEESGSGIGTVSRVRSMASLTGFIPYRFNSIEEDPRWKRYVQFVEGVDRYATAARASGVGFTSASSVVVASGENWPDALGAAGLAGAVKGPVLLVQHDRVPAPVFGEIDRLKAKKVFIIGGVGVVSSGVEQSFRDKGIAVERIGGRNRYQTAGAVARRTVKALADAHRPWDGTVLLANGDDWPDAVAASAPSARMGWPIVLSPSGDLAVEASATLGTLNARRAILLGGEGMLTDAVWREVSDRGIQAERWSGRNRRLTALEIANRCALLGMTWKNVAVTSDASFADALAGGVMQAQTGSLVLLNPSRGLDASVAAAIKAHKAGIGVARTLGGDAAIDYEVRHSIYDILGTP